MILNLLRQHFWNRRRLLFRFHDGRRVRGIDPVEVLTRLADHEDYLPRHLSDAVNGDRESQQIVAKAACEAFGVKPYDGKRTGLTVAERLHLMLTFDAWTIVVKKNIASWPIQQHSTA